MLCSIVEPPGIMHRICRIYWIYWKQVMAARINPGFPTVVYTSSLKLPDAAGEETERERKGKKEEKGNKVCEKDGGVKGEKRGRKA